jgi:hypothetical protein
MTDHPETHHQPPLPAQGMPDAPRGSAEQSGRVDTQADRARNRFSNAVQLAFTGNHEALRAFPDVVQAEISPLVEEFLAANTPGEKFAIASRLGDRKLIKKVLGNAGFNEDAIDQALDTMRDLPPEPVRPDDRERIGPYDAEAPSVLTEDQADAMEMARELQEITNGYSQLDPNNPIDEEVRTVLDKKSKTAMQRFIKDFGRLSKSGTMIGLKVGGIGILVFIALQVVVLMASGAGGKK